MGPPYGSASFWMQRLSQRQKRIFTENSPNYGPLGQRLCLVVGVGWCCSFSTLFTGPIWTDLRCKDFLILSIRAMEHAGD